LAGRSLRPANLCAELVLQLALCQESGHLGLLDGREILGLVHRLTVHEKPTQMPNPNIQG
jgi:hypothetical protein